MKLTPGKVLTLRGKDFFQVGKCATCGRNMRIDCPSAFCSEGCKYIYNNYSDTGQFIGDFRRNLYQQSDYESYWGLNSGSLGGDRKKNGGINHCYLDEI